MPPSWNYEIFSVGNLDQYVTGRTTGPALLARSARDGDDLPIDPIAIFGAEESNNPRDVLRFLVADNAISKGSHTHFIRSEGQRHNEQLTAHLPRGQ